MRIPNGPLTSRQQTPWWRAKSVLRTEPDQDLHILILPDLGAIDGVALWLSKQERWRQTMLVRGYGREDAMRGVPSDVPMVNQEYYLAGGYVDTKALCQ